MKATTSLPDTSSERRYYFRATRTTLHGSKHAGRESAYSGHQQSVAIESQDKEAERSNRKLETAIELEKT
jgi:hypothetical protein